MTKNNYLTDSPVSPSFPQDHFLDEPGLPSGTTRFWFIRHGIVEKRARQTMYGTQDVPLCPNSVNNDQYAYKSLAQQLPDDSLWFSSPLCRARQTGENIQKAGGISYPIQIEKNFIEQSIGQWSGQPHITFPSLLSSPPHPFWSIAAHETPPRGENMQTVKERIGQTLQRLAMKHKGHDMIVLSHGGAIRMALAHALSIEPDTALHFTIQNLSISIIENIEEKWRVISVNTLPNFKEIR